MIGLLGAASSVADSDLQLMWRKEDIQRRIVHDARSEMGEKSEMLRAICELSALIAGFSIVALAETPLEDQGLPEALVISFAVSSALTVCLMSMSMINCLFIIVGICKFNVK